MFQYSLTRKDGSGCGCGSGKTVPTVPVPLSVSGKTVPTVPRFPVPVRFLSHPVIFRLATPSGAPRQAPLEIRSQCDDSIWHSFVREKLKGNN